MRSKTSWWIALVAFLMLGVAACSSPPSSNRSKEYQPTIEIVQTVSASCENVTDEIEETLDLLGSAKKVLASAEEDTLVYGLATKAVDTLTERLSDLEAEAQECSVDETDDPVQCLPEFVQVDVDRSNNRVNNEFAKQYAAAMAGGLNQAEFVLEQAGSDGLTLATFANAYGLYDDPNDWAGLVEGDCLSQNGQNLWYQLKGVLTAEGNVTMEGEAPANGTNSGVSDGIFGVADTPGISGDRTAIVTVLRDGSSVWIMIRCGNVVYLIPPPMLPKIPTDSSGPQGNAPEGEGLNLDTTRGEHIPRGSMDDPPAGVRVNEPAPTQTEPPEGSTPDSDLPPESEDEEPPIDPDEGSGCAPGRTC